MEFKSLSAAEYRALSHDAFESRRAEIQRLLQDSECDVDIEVLKAEVALIAAEAERRSLEREVRSMRIREVAGGAGNVTEQFRAGGVERTCSVIADDPFDSTEYRDAFVRYMQTGERTPGLLRADGDTPETPPTPAATAAVGMMTSDVPVAIPTTLSNTIIERLDGYDDIYSQVTKTNLQGGVEYAIEDFDFETTWVDEDEVSEWQKAERNDKISFKYHEFECRMQYSFLSGIVTMDNLTSKFAPKMERSILKMLNPAIINGSGTGQMLGILNDSRITNVIEMTESQFKDWKSWHSIFDADIDPDYADGQIMMAKKSWNMYIDTMADNNNAPVGYTYDPVSGKRTNLLVGYKTQLVRNAILPDFGSAKAGDVVGIYGDLRNYCVNWQPNGHITIMRYPDWDKRKNKIVGYGVCDGRVIDPYGFYLIKKKASA